MIFNIIRNRYLTTFKNLKEKKEKDPEQTTKATLKAIKQIPSSS